ncbi:MAG: hypothetical protein Q7S45_00245 [Candidatus Curtissbacteria bacterium]|nr:hypothetical protein [Candidatus Curtissbacteria bacterium]
MVETLTPPQISPEAQAALEDLNRFLNLDNCAHYPYTVSRMFLNLVADFFSAEVGHEGPDTDYFKFTVGRSADRPLNSNNFNLIFAVNGRVEITPIWSGVRGEPVSDEYLEGQGLVVIPALQRAIITIVEYEARKAEEKARKPAEPSPNPV